MDLYWAVTGKIRNKTAVQVLENRKDSNFRKGVNSQSFLDDIWLSYRGRAAETIASSLSPREQVMSSVAGEWEKKLNPLPLKEEQEVLNSDSQRSTVTGPRDRSLRKAHTWDSSPA